MITTIEEFERQLNEGLIKSFSIKDTMSFVWKALVQLKNQSDISIERNVNNTIELNIDNPTKNLIEYLNSELNLFGWYTANYIGILPNKKSEYFIFNYDKLINDLHKYVSISFILESKFDHKPFIKPDYLYHITDTRNIEKILKTGLIPKSKNKISYHPERIYFTENLEGLNKLINRFYSKDEELDKYRTYTKLKIKNDNYILYIDPNFLNMNAYYTYDNINPKNIEIISEIK